MRAQSGIRVIFTCEEESGHSSREEGRRTQRSISCSSEPFLSAQTVFGGTFLIVTSITKLDNVSGKQRSDRSQLCPENSAHLLTRYWKVFCRQTVAFSRNW